MPNALLVYSEHPPAYWGAKYALDLIGIRAVFPPLGLLTIAAMFPSRYDLRVVDMNVTALEDSDLEWADLVLASSMIVQRGSQPPIIERCNRAGVPVVAGGPYPTSYHEEIEGVDHFVLGEAEETFPQFLRDLENGNARPIYLEPRKPDITRTPVPRFDLIDTKNYHSMCVQFSRGCPFDCEFCDITKLFGRVPRTKSPEQMVNEFESLYRLGWRGPVFLVDDNFIGNKRDAMQLLPVLGEWQKAHRYPFTLFTEATVNLARMDKLMDAMIEAGFDSVFLGIETPNPKALRTTKKPQNFSKGDDNYLLNSVRKIQRKGMQVMGGFILGLDDDDESVFDSQIEFIQEAGIPLAPIYMLSALKNTDLYTRLASENRLLDVPVEIDATFLNFKPQMDPRTLVEGYRRVVTTLYDPALENYFERCLTLFAHLEPVPHLYKSRSELALYAEIVGLRRHLSPRQAPTFMKFIARVSKDHPRMLPEAIRLAALGFHFEKVTRQQLAIHDFKRFLAAEIATLEEEAAHRDREAAMSGDSKSELFTRVEGRYASLPQEFRYPGDGIDTAITSFRSAVNARTDRSVSLSGV